MNENSNILKKTSRNFILTLNPVALEYYQDILNYLKSLIGLIYILVVEHIGEPDATRHYHIYVQYERSKRLSIKKLHGAHAEKCYGSSQQNIAYCKCEDDKHKALGVSAITILEEGTPRLNGGTWSVAELRDIEVPDELPGVYYNTWKKLKDDEECDVDIDDLFKDIKVYWIQGPSGVGKTNKAKSIVRQNKDIYGTKVNWIKYENGFYLGVGNTEIAIYDDFRDSHMKPSEFIHLIDYNKHFMNIKGGRKFNNYKLIIFTSVQKLSNIYKRFTINDEEPRLQWERRIEVIDMYPPERVHLGGLPVGYRTDFNQLEEYEVTDDWDDTRTIIN